MFRRSNYLVPERPVAGSVVVSVQDLRVTLGGKQVLGGVSLDLHAGELLALVGPNGAGKSTLLGAMTGDLPYDGSIKMGGKDLSTWNLAELARYRAVLPQQNLLAFPFQVRDVVEMGRAPWRKTPLEDEDDTAIDEAIARMEIADFSTRPYPALSGGERARVALARVLAQRAGVLLLDEPTAALDIRHQEAVMQLARERANMGDGVVVVLHELSLAAAYADTITLLSKGEIFAHGSPSEVMTAAAISEVYQYPVTVVPNPETATPMVVPLRTFPNSSQER